MTERGPTDQTVLVTGGAGFIGSHLVDRLVDDNEVRVLDNLSTGSRENLPAHAELIVGDVRSTDDLSRATQGVDIVFHQAAQVSVERSIEDPPGSFSSNLEPTIDILELARQRDFRVIVASSCAIYGNPEYTPIDEGHRKEPSSPYGLEKLTVDRYTRLYNELYDIETVALRYFNVYGPRQSAGDYSGVISIFREQAESGEDLTVEGDGQQTRDFVHVDDIVRANMYAAETDETGYAYNVGTGSATSIRELAETIQDLSDSNSDIVHIAERKGDIAESEADITLIRDKMDFEPRIPLQQGLKSLMS
ncbi:NAD-dependent epimerase/dehydratase family protein [Haloplanus halophilus]|uniref:NAD-dependent epimerase/dehydratase family protein n=1 Tax=Haloplanus halophilus TaxID=2949993 RepID=UPI002041EAA5|nr:NAD-dependent epimerase/dehydratase family protein [Haloplanus sp. GDY1]